MDPYCVCKLGPQKQRTRAHTDGGKYPTWKDTLNFPRRQGEQLLEIEVWDKDTVSEDDLVGQTTVSVQQLINSKNKTEWFDLSYKGKKAGAILIEYQFVQDNQQQSGFGNSGIYKSQPGVVPMMPSGVFNGYPPQQNPYQNNYSQIGFNPYATNQYPNQPGYPGSQIGGYPPQPGYQPPPYPQQPGGYPPSQPGYPPQQPGYPPQQPGFPPQQPGYPPQQPGYPPQQPGFPPQQPGFPPQQPGYPPQQPSYPPQQPGYPAQQPPYPGQQPGYPGGSPQAPYPPPGQQGGYPGQQPQQPGYPPQGVQPPFGAQQPFGGAPLPNPLTDAPGQYPPPPQGGQNYPPSQPNQNYPPPQGFGNTMGQQPPTGYNQSPFSKTQGY